MHGLVFIVFFYSSNSFIFAWALLFVVRHRLQLLILSTKTCVRRSSMGRFTFFFRASHYHRLCLHTRPGDSTRALDFQRPGQDHFRVRVHSRVLVALRNRAPGARAHQVRHRHPQHRGQPGEAMALCCIQAEEYMGSRSIKLPLPIRASGRLPFQLLI